MKNIVVVDVDLHKKNNTELHVKILLQICKTALLKILV